MTRLPSFFLPLFAVLISTAPGFVLAEGIPEEVALELEKAAFPDRLDTFVGSFTLTTESVVQKANGSKRHETTTVIDVTRTSDGTVHHRLISVLAFNREVVVDQRISNLKVTTEK